LNYLQISQLVVRDRKDINTADDKIATVISIISLTFLSNAIDLLEECRDYDKIYILRALKMKNF